MKISLTRTVGFRAHHRLSDPDRTDAENRARFGSTTDSHPHDYRCEVTVSGPVDERQPMVMDLGLLDLILAEQVTRRFDGTHLDRDVPELRDVLTTCEGIARDVFRRIAERLPAGIELERVVIAEDATLRAECRAS